MYALLYRTGLFAALGFSLVVSACSKDKDEPAPVLPPSSWQVDGQAQQSQKVTVEVGTRNYNRNTLTINIWQTFNTAGSTGSVVVLTMRVPQSVGTYSFADVNANASASYSDDTNAGQGSGLYLATSGSVTISALTSNSVTGTFAFKGAQLFNPQVTKSITNGQFHTTF